MEVTDPFEGLGDRSLKKWTLAKLQNRRIIRREEENCYLMSGLRFNFIVTIIIIIIIINITIIKMERAGG